MWINVGIWPSFDKVDKKLAYEPVCAHRSPDMALVASGDTAGGVKVYNCPCVNKETDFVEMKMHMKDVNKVRFTCDSQFLISIGQSDRSIIIWKVLPDHAKGGSKPLTG